jgi:hypothetical protein
MSSSTNHGITRTWPELASWSDGDRRNFQKLSTISSVCMTTMAEGSENARRIKGMLDHAIAGNALFLAPFSNGISSASNPTTPFSINSRFKYPSPAVFHPVNSRSFPKHARRFFLRDSRVGRRVRDATI